MVQHRRMIRLRLMLLILVRIANGWSSTITHPSQKHHIFLHLNAFTQGNRDDNYSKQIRDRTRIKDNRKISSEKTVVILYHKPANVITSHSNMDESPGDTSERRRTVYEDIYRMNGYVANIKHNDKQLTGKYPNSFEDLTGIKSKLHAIGRLDADTTGLLLLTNDGGLVHRITNPTSKDKSDANNNIVTKSIPKTYEAIIMGRHTLDESSTNGTNPLDILLTEGIALSPKHGGHTKPVDNLRILSHPTRTTTQVSITISEGKNRQIRRMFHAIGSGVMKLHRVSVGGITLGELQEGEWRMLSEDEVLSGLGYKCRIIDSEGSKVTTQMKPKQLNAPRSKRKTR